MGTLQGPIIKGARYSLIIHEVLVAIGGGGGGGGVPAGVQDDTPKEESERLAS